MVTINLTLFIEVGLFLVFMWAINLLVFRPLLNLMDSRDDKMLRDRETARSAASEADGLEQQYALESARIHREASRDVVRAHRKVQEAHYERLAELKAQGESELDAVRREVRESIAREQDQFDSLASDLAGFMAQQLGGKGNVV